MSLVFPLEPDDADLIPLGDLEYYEDLETAQELPSEVIIEEFEILDVVVDGLNDDDDEPNENSSAADNNSKKLLPAKSLSKRKTKITRHATSRASYNLRSKKTVASPSVSYNLGVATSTVATSRTAETPIALPEDITAKEPKTSSVTSSEDTTLKEPKIPRKTFSEDTTSKATETASVTFSEDTTSKATETPSPMVTFSEDTTSKATETPSPRVTFSEDTTSKATETPSPRVTFSEDTTSKATENPRVTFSKDTTSKATETSRETFSEDTTSKATETPRETFSEDTTSKATETPRETFSEDTTSKATETPSPRVTFSKDTTSKATETPRETFSEDTTSKATETPRETFAEDTTSKATETPSPRVTFSEDTTSKATETPRETFSEDTTSKATETPRVTFSNDTTSKAPKTPRVTFSEDTTSKAPKTLRVTFSEDTTSKAPKTPRVTFSEDNTSKAPKTPRVTFSEDTTSKSPKTPRVTFSEDTTSKAPKTPRVTFSEETASKAPKTPRVTFSEDTTSKAPKIPRVTFSEDTTSKALKTPRVTSSEDTTSKAPKTPGVTFSEDNKSSPQSSFSRNSRNKHSNYPLKKRPLKATQKQDSGSEQEDESDEDNDEEWGNNAYDATPTKMSFIARKLREIQVLEEEGEREAIVEFLIESDIDLCDVLPSSQVSHDDINQVIPYLFHASSSPSAPTASLPPLPAESSPFAPPSPPPSTPSPPSPPPSAPSAPSTPPASFLSSVSSSPSPPYSPHTSEIDTSFSWSEDYSEFLGQEEVYTKSSGPIKGFLNDPEKLFMEVWDLPIVQHIVDETNRYAWQNIATIMENNLPLSQSVGNWTEVDVAEMYRFLAILNYMSIDYRSRLDEYWKLGILGMPEFRRIMPRNRFSAILRFLHFINNDSMSPDLRSHDRKIAKIAPVLQHCNQKFSSMYIPQKQLSLDETLLLWKGRLSWVQSIRTKAARFGIKSFELCESATGYLLKSQLYTGKDSTSVDSVTLASKNPSANLNSSKLFDNPTAKLVLDLMDGYLDVGHTLVMDNWYNQLVLTRYLKKRHTDVIGTLNRRRAHVPDIIKYANEKHMPRGSQIARHCGDISLVAWKDVKLVTLISTCHNADTTTCQRMGIEYQKPKVVNAYNKSMGGVDLKDQKLSFYFYERKRGKKWYMKLFKRLINTSIMNIYIIFTRVPSISRTLTNREFRFKISEGLLANFPKLQVDKPLPISKESKEVRLDRAANHYPNKTQVVNGKPARRRCARCSAQGKQTRVTIMCQKCEVALCIGQCWIDYHTLLKL